jgi:hypothetical protein
MLYISLRQSKFNYGENSDDKTSPKTCVPYGNGSSRRSGKRIFISWLLKRQELSAPVRLGLALIPVAAYAFCLISYLLLIQMGDKLQRRIRLEALGIAFPTSAVAVLACEYLRKAGFIAQFKPDYVLMLMLALWALG